MINKTPLKTIITYWASSLPYKVRIHLFGSYLKNIPDRLVSDIDISLEFLHPFSKDERTDLWFQYHRKWEKQLSDEIGEKIHLCLFEGNDSPQMQQNLKDASILLYEPEEDQKVES